MIITSILGVSIALQFAASVLAIRLIRVSGRWHAWTFISTAILLMALRRGVRFYRLISGDMAYPPDLYDELTALAISFLMVIGISYIASIFTERRRAEERIVHLNAVLRAIRNVNQLIVREKDRDRLIQGACDSLIETRGYNCAWLALTGEEGGVHSYAVAGFSEATGSLTGCWERGELMPCEKKSLVSSVVIAYEKRDALCDACPLVNELPDHSALLVRLEHEGRVYGFLHVAVFGDWAFDAEEQALFVEVASDISFALRALAGEEEHKRAEEALRESEERFRRLAENSPDVIIRAIPERGVEYVNPIIEEITGYSPDEITGDWGFLASKIHPGDRHNFISKFKDSCEHGTGNRLVEFRFIAKDGADVWFEARFMSVWDERGEVSSFECVARDITEHMMAEQALRESEERYRSLAENAPNSIMIVDRDGMIRFINHTVAGLTREEAVGKSHYDFIEPEFHDVVRETLNRVFQTGEIDGYEIRGTGPDGQISWYQSMIGPIRREGRIDAATIIVTDITEHKHSEKEREEMQRRLMQSEKLSAIGELISGVAHELNNPLSAVLGFSQLLLLEQDRPKKERAADLRKIVDNAERCQRIVQNLLVFARRHRPEKGDADIISVIEDVVVLREYQLRVEDIAILRTYPERNACINLFADRHQLHQVLLNLINNAEHSILETGKPGAIIINVERENGDILIVVEDTGKGIRKENMARIFDPFYTTKETGVGTGLGLSVSYGIVQEHGGTIWAMSEYGHGATFYIRLPVSEKKAVKKKAPRAKAPAKGKYSGSKILVIDDEHPILNVMERVLRRGGYVVECVDNGEEAIALLKEKSYGLIISDMRMPEVSGEEIYVFLKENRPDLIEKIIFTTGDTVNEVTRKFFEVSGVTFLGKPFGVEVLLNAVEEGFARCEEKS
ncbi:MAG: PAS domain S-box protein [bacterium]